MGDPRFPRKKYETPSHPWQGGRIARERELLHKYGLKNKTEVWRTATYLRRLRGNARRLLARQRQGQEEAEKEKKEILDRIARLGMLPSNSTLDDVLALTVENVLARRLQTLVYLHGLARTPKQARQLIIHGHIAVNGRRTRIPSYLVKRTEEENITYSYVSPLNDELHPMRPRAEERERIRRGAEESEEAAPERHERENRAGGKRGRDRQHRNRSGGKTPHRKGGERPAGQHGRPEDRQKKDASPQAQKPAADTKEEKPKQSKDQKPEKEVATTQGEEE
jgi:small subunit ribosomal protein S4